ncbi:MAG TPA: DUF4846 domain-containing protein [Saprospiraceae bacterium]|nr:DUF4846 domain-containing protein [Saprospiraceae bacterium]HPI08696.1 DUF4846 domain-containing protein [Saprospiraceae bacterium]
MKTLLLFFLFFRSCFQPVLPNAQAPADLQVSSSDSLLFQRFTPPPGFKRIPATPTSFASHLRHLPLKPPGSPVLLYDSRQKRNQTAHVAVVDLPIGKRDLHQCADAVIRLRAEYLWKTKQYKKIHFNLTNGFRVDYDRWRKGGRVKVTGNKTEWVQTAAASDSYAVFWQYLEFVFTYAGTLSLSRELTPVAFSDMEIGDVLIQGGSPGHAVIVVDMAVNDAGEKMFLLAQSYMPAQEIQILKNPANADGTPWYRTVSEGELDTPEWTFMTTDLKRFTTD